MSQLKLIYGAFLSCMACFTGHAQEPKKPIDPPASSKLVPFEGCGKKEKKGTWSELYYNCKGFDGATFSPAPPCKSGWVSVKEAVPIELVSHLEQCIYEL